MTAQSAIPLKWYVPFASGDSARVEIPVTSNDATRASQTLGFPPLTMQPPAVGGVPPQGEDFNGAMNQVARIAWWVLNGGGWPYDATFATNSNIGGYPNGAVLQSADFLGQWISTADNNQNNPDTVGTSWVPGFQYGSTAVTGQTGGTTTLTPLQAAKRGITISGTLTSALTVIMPTWIKDWSITNNTTGAYAVVVKTAAGSGVTIPQNGSPTPVAGDGTNVTQLAQNIAVGTSNTHAAQVSQTVGRLLNVQVFTSSGTYTPTAGAKTAIIEQCGGGGGGGSTAAAGSTVSSCAGSGGGGAYLKAQISLSGITTGTVTIGAGGTGAASGAASMGGVGGSTIFSATGITLTAPGGNGGVAGANATPPFLTQGAASAMATAVGGTILQAQPSDWSERGLVVNTSGGRTGNGGASKFGIGATGVVGGAGQAATASGYGYGGGGSGGLSLGGGNSFAGGNGAPGYMLIYEYA